MKQRFVGIFWGLVLVIIGAYFLITQTNSISITDPKVGLALFGALSLLFFATYFVNGREKWGWLFPACISLGLAVAMLAMIINPAIEGTWVPAVIIFSVAVPFIVAYALAPKPRWWALIPAYAITIVALIPLFAENAPGEVVGAFFMWAIALPFFVVYLRDRTRWWALIPAGAMAIIGIFPLLSLGIDSDLVGGIVLLLIAAPFLVVYLWNQVNNWWAMIPLGILGWIGVTVFVTTLAHPGGEALSSRLGLGVLFLGWALTFFVLWWRRAVIPTRWAIYPAAVLAVLGVAGLIGGQDIMKFAAPLALIAVGAWIIWRWQGRKTV
jgi:hypothetical protein